LHMQWGQLREFCQDVNDNGLSINDLIIGLRAKERESKVEDRFFAMMLWNLRLYFVVTEYLIKRDFLGLFPGITMKDTLNEVQKKILNASQGQGSAIGAI
jgi:Mononegavirales RNA dependent RNA polymerase